MKKTIFTILCAFVSIALFAEEEMKEKKFSVTGKPIVTIFGNFHAGLGHANDNAGFDLERAYLGYQFKVMNDLEGKVVFDIGSSKVNGSDLERIAYVKNAMLSWTPGKFTLDFGLIGLEHFNIQEKFWGYRYILKSFSDEYKFGSSADLGVIGKYKFTDWISADLTVVNGEGYKKLNKDNNFRYGAGVTVTPVKNLTVRTYYDMSDGDGDDAKQQQSLALFAGYKHSKFSVGAEYNLLNNTKWVEDNNQSGFSVYASTKVAKQFAVFGRYDNLSSKNDWNRKNDGQRMLVGMQYEPIKYLRLSPNFTSWNPGAGRAESYVFLNLEFKL